MQAQAAAKKRVKYLVCVDDREASRVALRYAAHQAKTHGGHLDILHVMEPAGFKGLSSVVETMREEKREKTEQLMQELAEEVQHWCGITPSLLMREGEIVEQIVAAVQEDFDVNVLVLASSPESRSQGSVFRALTADQGHRLQIPMVIIPHVMTEQEIEQMV